MSKLTYQLGILITILLGAILNYYYCCNMEEEIVVEEIVSEPVIEPTKNPFLVQDANGNLDVKVNDNFNFQASEMVILEPLSERVIGGVTELSAYLAEHPDKSVSITGYYKGDEVNHTAYPNLGLARAGAVKNYFVSKGISSRIIDTHGKLYDGMVPDADNIYYGPVEFAVATTGDHGDLDALADEINKDPLVLNFGIDKFVINLTEEQRHKFAKISRYLDKAEGSTCNIVGHTDTTGPEDHNMVLGKERADFAKAYLVRHHIPESKVITVSKGSSEPIADNSTTEGRAANRRTIVTVNKP
ncbi:OmpA family protein [Mangrovimonas sp. YM274]|uniref:OmpA family protein n=1 Tax=Mangrovimonas sp. YM274 TaxID=3070660 RepID=UPI0027DE5DD2|nr:OmpA family protein [Mangrovimonas sp. YM274]WMI68750.1 OmpA family protein [Mangrovimonas sp. YM274]